MRESTKVTTKRKRESTIIYGRPHKFFQGATWASEGFFPGGSVGEFPKIFSRGARSGEICFLPLEIEKTTFFC